MKYKLAEKKFFSELNKELWQIEAVADFGDVKKGERGGWIEREDNLSQYDNAWVRGNARVYGYARVFDNALVSGEAHVYGDAWIYTNAHVYGEARVYGGAQVCGEAWVFDKAQVYGSALVKGSAIICDNALVYDYALISGPARIRGNAEIRNLKEILVLGKLGNERRYITCTPDKSHKMQISCGCFLGGIDAFEKAVREKYGDDPNSDYMLIIPLLKKKEAEWAKGKE